VLQQLQLWIRLEARPDDARPVNPGECAEAGERELQRVAAGGDPSQRRSQLHLAGLRYFSEKFERDVDPLRRHPFDRQSQLPHRCRRRP